MKVTLETEGEGKAKKTFIVIKAEVDAALPVSGSGKSKMLFTTSGNKQSELKYQGESVVIGLNAYIKNADFKPSAKE